MKKVMAIAAALSLLLTMAVAMPASAALSDLLTGETLVTNGDFSDGITGWGTPGTTTIVHGKAVPVGEPADNYVQLTPNKNAEGGYISGAGQLNQFVAVEPGAVYLAEVTYKAITNNSAWLVLANNWTGITDAFLPATGETLETAEWGTYQLMVRIPYSLEQLNVYLRQYPWNGPDEGCYFDEVQLYKVDGVDPENLVTNAGFEFDDNGATEIYGWTQTSTEFSYKAWQTVDDPAGMGYCPPTEENGKNVAYVMASGATAPVGLKQTITLDINADYYMDFENYTWNLSFDTYKGNSNSYPAVKVTATDAGGATASATWTMGTELAWDTENIVAAAMYRNTVNLDSITAEFENPVATFEIELSTQVEAAWDNIILKPTYVEPEPAYNYAVNPSFESMTNGVLDNWTFVDTTQKEALGTNGGSDGDNYIGLLDMTRAELVMDGDQIPGASAYKLIFDYKQLDIYGFIKIEDAVTGAKILEGAMGEATGDSEETLEWKRYEVTFILREENSSGIKLLLRNGPSSSLCYYDDVRIEKIEGYDIDNLLINGGFDMAAVAGSTSVFGWSNVNASCQATVGILAGEYVADMPAATSQLAQSVEITDFDAANQQNYGYTFTIDHEYGRGGYPAFTLTALFEDGTKVEQRVNIVRSAADVTDPKSMIYSELRQWNALVYDMTWMTQSTTSPVSAIRVDLHSGGGGTVFDNARLTVNKPRVSISGEDGAITGITDCENAAFTAEGSYFGEATDATLFFVVYDVLEDGTLQLADVKMVSGIANGATEELTFDALTLRSGKQIMSAILLEKGSMKPVVAKIID